MKQGKTIQDKLPVVSNINMGELQLYMAAHSLSQVYRGSF